MFIYKDFTLRELLTSAIRFAPEEQSELSKNFESLRKIFLTKVEDSYQEFVK